jgi:hypothetical protein
MDPSCSLRECTQAWSGRQNLCAWRVLEAFAFRPKELINLLEGERAKVIALTEVGDHSGKITSTVGTLRQIQMALKLVFSAVGTHSLSLVVPCRGVPFTCRAARVSKRGILRPITNANERISTGSWYVSGSERADDAYSMAFNIPDFAAPP